PARARSHVEYTIAGADTGRLDEHRTKRGHHVGDDGRVVAGCPHRAMLGRQRGIDGLGLGAHLVLLARAVVLRTSSVERYPLSTTKSVLTVVQDLYCPQQGGASQ